MTSSATPSRERRPSRRDDQTRETKRRLVVAAVELVMEVGWRRTTVEQIAERAGVAKGTFFVHFKTKEAIVITLVQLQIGAARAARETVVAKGGSAASRLRTATLTLGAQAAASIELSRAVLIACMESSEVGSESDAVFKQLYSLMIDDAREALATGEFGSHDGSPDAETAAGLLMACYLGATLHCTSSPAAKPLDDVLRPLVDATLAALTAKKPRPKNEAKRAPESATKRPKTKSRRRGEKA
jgi:AcrR family transcriptional regulator